jgi:hypothetical protein
MKKVTSIPLRARTPRVTACLCFFNSEDEEYRVLLPFIKDGFESGDKAIHVVSSDQRCDHLKRLAAAGIDADAARKSGQFELRTNAETYLRDGRFDLYQMLDAFEQWASDTAKTSFPRNRIVCHMDWAVEAGSQIDNVAEFESRGMMCGFATKTR